MNKYTYLGVNGILTLKKNGVNWGCIESTSMSCTIIRELIEEIEKKNKIDFIFKQLSKEELSYLEHAMICVDLTSDMSDDMESAYEKDKGIREHINKALANARNT